MFDERDVNSYPAGLKDAYHEGSKVSAAEALFGLCVFTEQLAQHLVHLLWSELLHSGQYTGRIHTEVKPDARHSFGSWIHYLKTLWPMVEELKVRSEVTTAARWRSDPSRTAMGELISAHDLCRQTIESSNELRLALVAFSGDVAQPGASVPSFFDAVWFLRNIQSHRPYKYTRKDGTVAHLTLQEQFYEQARDRLRDALHEVLHELKEPLTRLAEAEVVAYSRGPQRYTMEVQTVEDGKQGHTKTVNDSQYFQPGTRHWLSLRNPPSFHVPAWRFPEHAPQVDVPPELRAANRAAQDGLLVPVLGPGCHALHRGAAAPRVKGRLVALLARLKDEQYDEQHMSFATSVAISCLPDIARERPLAPRAWPWEDALLKLQVDLVALGVLASGILGQSFTQHPRGMTDVSTFGVPLLEDGRKQIEKILKQCITDAQGLHNVAGDATSQGLGVGGIGRHLEAVWTSLTVGGSLSLVQFEWLCDLLWHTLRFDAPMYPTPDELALQLALCVEMDRASPRRDSMGLVAHFTPQEQRPELIKTWLSTCRDRDSSPDFFQSLAKALSRPYGGPRGLSEGGPPRSGQAPIVIDTNFDDELGCALRQHEWPYHMVLPVSLVGGVKGRRRATGSPPPADWLIETVRYTDGAVRREWRLLGHRSLDLATREGFPIVIKLHGAPLQDLPTVDRLQSEGALDTNLDLRALKHRVALSDYDVLSGLTREIGGWLPDGVARTIQARSLCFFGFPSADFRNRMYLWQHVSAQRGTDDKGDAYMPEGTALLIDSPRDPVRHVMALQMNVLVIDMLAGKVAEAISV